MTLIKWPGGKRGQASRIDELFGEPCKVHVEPFFGGGSVALHRLSVKRAASVVASDVNARLMVMWTAVRDTPGDVDAWLRAWETSPPDYLEMRRRFNEDPMDSGKMGATLIWLMKACFNGAYRENARGIFNTPEGSGGFVLPTADQIFAISGLLQAATIQRSSYLHADIRPGPGVHIYCDPPYWPRNPTFNYTGGGFDARDQATLARLARRWADEGSTVIVSNHDLPETRRLYADHGVTEVVAHAVSRPIACKPESRRKVGEIYAIWRPYAAN